MNLESLFRQIESHDFAARLSVANNLEMFCALLAQDATARNLVTQLASDKEQAVYLLSRANSLIREQDDVRYRNSHDEAIGVYLWALMQSRPALGRIAASAILSTPRLWWARKLALRVVSDSWPYLISEPKTGNVLTNTSEWKLTNAGLKNVLIVSNPDEGLIRDRRVLDPDKLNVKADRQKEQKTEPGYSVSSQAELVKQ